MSQRTSVAIFYGALSILTFGVALGLTIALGWKVWPAWLAFEGIQIVFAFFAMGYSAGRSDEHKGKVAPKMYY